jgi:hypothetical protein
LELASKNAAIGIIAAGALVGWFACKAKKIGSTGNLVV